MMSRTQRLYAAALAIVLATLLFFTAAAAQEPFDSFCEKHPTSCVHREYYFPDGTPERFDPLPKYRRIYYKLKGCLLKHGFEIRDGARFDDLTFWKAERIWFLSGAKGRQLNGVWMYTGHIVIRTSRLNSSTVHHEMLHDLLEHGSHGYGYTDAHRSATYLCVNVGK